jgi:hypothetical protein
MLGLLLLILILIGGFFVIAFFIELGVVLFLGFTGIILWGYGIGGQAIVVVLILAYIFTSHKR